MVLFLSYVWNRIFSNEDKETNESIDELSKSENINKSKNEILNKSQNNVPMKSVEKLVFEGGGIKGIAFLGSLSVMKDQLCNVNAFAGTSVGSIAATLMAIGYELDETKDIMWNTDFKKFFDHEYDIPIDMYSIIKDYGICSGNNFNKWITNLIEKKTGNENYTFNQLWEERKKDLVIVTTNITCLNPKYLSYRNHPGMALKDAIRMSMSIPMVFNPVKFEDNYYVDGGVIDNYPIHVFDGKYPGDIDAINNRVPANKNTLGFRLLSNYDDTSSSESLKKYPIKSVLSYSMAVFEGVLKSTSRQYNGDRSWNRTLQIYTHNISALDFSLSEKDKEELYQSGIDAALDYFRK